MTIYAEIMVNGSVSFYQKTPFNEIKNNVDRLNLALYLIARCVSARGRIYDDKVMADDHPCDGLQIAYYDDTVNAEDNIDVYSLKVTFNNEAL